MVFSRKQSPIFWTRFLVPSEPTAAARARARGTRTVRTGRGRGELRGRVITGSNRFDLPHRFMDRLRFQSLKIVS